MIKMRAIRRWMMIMLISFIGMVIAPIIIV